MKKFFIICLACILLLSACGKKEEEHIEWTYELLEEEFGGIIDMDFDSLKTSLEIINEHDFAIYGYVTEIDSYKITITDDMKNSYDFNSVKVYGFSSDDLAEVNIGDMVYASGRIYYLGGLVELNCSVGDGYISWDPIDGASSVREYVETIKLICEDTYFRSEGLIMQEGTFSNGTPMYKFYASEESYKESKYAYIFVEFMEEQHNLNGRTVVIMGRPDSFMAKSLIECSVIEER